MVNYITEIFNSSLSSGIDTYLNSLELELQVQVKIRKIRRAKRITLRVCNRSRHLSITLPTNFSLGVLKNFINSNLAWIRQQIQQLDKKVLIAKGTSIPLLGFERIISVEPTFESKYLLTKTMLIIPKTETFSSNQIKDIFIRIAEEFFTECCKKYAKSLGVNFLKIVIRDPKSRWGSCSSKRNLMFSWRLIMAPREISEYVAAHEVAHLVYMDHSNNFWDTVQEIYPNYRSQRYWLRQHGGKLHSYIFD